MRGRSIGLLAALVACGVPTGQSATQPAPETRLADPLRPVPAVDPDRIDSPETVVAPIAQPPSDTTPAAIVAQVEPSAPASVGALPTTDPESLLAARRRITNLYPDQTASARPPSCALTFVGREDGVDGDSGGRYLRFRRGGLVRSLAWDSDVLGGGATEHYRYDARGQLSSVRHESEPDMPVYQGIVRYRTEVDGDAIRVRVTDTPEGQEAEDIFGWALYEYDDAGRVVARTLVGHQRHDDERIACEYDERGRPSRTTRQPVLEDGSVDGDTEIRETTYHYEGDRLVAIGPKNVWEIRRGFVVDGGADDTDETFFHEVYTGQCAMYLFKDCAPSWAPPPPSGRRASWPDIAIGRELESE